MSMTGQAESIQNHAAIIRAALGGCLSKELDIDSTTLNSWQRCHDIYKLEPDCAPEALIVHPADLREKIERNANLLDIARPEMADLYQQLSGSGHAIMLTDREGVLLNYISDPGFSDAATHVGMQMGAVWSEAVQGTNGMGTCLVEKKPLVIHKSAHYFTVNAGLTCAAAPILDPHGEILAILDASSEARMAQQHTMVLLNMSAKMIENRVFFCAMRGHFILHFHSRAEFISTIGEGAIAFSPEGQIIAANRSALFQLDIPDFNQVENTKINTLFATTLSSLLQHANSSGFHAFPIRDAATERRFFAKVQAPESKGPPSSSADSRPCVVNLANSASTQGDDDFDSIHSGDPKMLININTARKVLSRDIPFVLFGETGTGKDVFARKIHQASSRCNKPFVAVNCASLPETLIESELFGYRPGAFTGANRAGSRGKIVQADGGTLFLDEIGDMPMHLQARLLRVLEERIVIPLGGEKPIPVSIRLISATHRDIHELIEQGDFREDLYYRLHGITLTMPPLRERSDRRELILKLAQEEANSTQAATWEPEALAYLEAYAWPGNMRQLRNVMRIATALCDNGHITLEDLPQDLFRADTNITAPGAEKDDLNSLNMAERDALLHELKAMHWNISRVSKKLALSRNTLYRKMKRYNITPPRE